MLQIFDQFGIIVFGHKDAISNLLRLKQKTEVILFDGLAFTH